MARVSSVEVKDLIALLQKHHSILGKPASLRRLSDIYGVSHQNLSNWRKGSKKQEELFEFIELAKKKLALDDARVYRKAIKIKNRSPDPDRPSVPKNGKTEQKA